MRFLVFLSALGLIAFGSYRQVEVRPASTGPSIRVAISLNKTELRQGELVTGTATITLSGFTKPTDITVSGFFGLAFNPAKTKRSLTLPQCANGEHKIVLSRALGLTVPFNAGGPIEVAIIATPVGSTDNRNFPGTSVTLNVEPMVESDGTLKVEEVRVDGPQKVRLGEQVKLECSFRASNLTSKSVEVQVNENLLLMGPDFKVFDDVTHAVTIPGRTVTSPNQVFRTKPKLPGLYVAQYKISTNHTPTILVFTSFEVTAATSSSSIQILQSACRPTSGPAGSTFTVSARYVATDPSTKTPTVEEVLEVVGPESKELPIRRALSEFEASGKDVAYQVTAFQPGEYKWRLTVSLGSKEDQALGTFTVVRGRAASENAWVCKGPADDKSKVGDMVVSGSKAVWTVPDWNEIQHEATVEWKDPPPVLGETEEGIISFSVSPFSGVAPERDLNGQHQVWHFSPSLSAIVQVNGFYRQAVSINGKETRDVAKIHNSGACAPHVEKQEASVKFILGSVNPWKNSLPPYNQDVGGKTARVSIIINPILGPKFVRTWIYEKGTGTAAGSLRLRDATSH